MISIASDTHERWTDRVGDFISIFKALQGSSIPNPTNTATPPSAPNPSKPHTQKRKHKTASNPVFAARSKPPQTSSPGHSQLSVHQSQPHPHALIPPHYKALHGPMIPTASPYHIHQYHMIINARGWIKRCIEANSLQPLTNEPYLNKQLHSATTQPQPCLQHDSNRSKRHHHVTLHSTH